jgi:hypothetical protein
VHEQTEGPQNAEFTENSQVNVRERYALRDADLSNNPALPLNDNLAIESLLKVDNDYVSSKTELVLHGHGSIRQRFSESWKVPELNVWHYKGEMVLGKQNILYTPAYVLPPSFRFPYHDTLRHELLEFHAERACAFRVDPPPPPKF